MKKLILMMFWTVLISSCTKSKSMEDLLAYVEDNGCASFRVLEKGKKFVMCTEEAYEDDTFNIITD